MPTNRQILLAARPEGAPGPEHFRLAETAAPEPRDGEVLLKTLWLSLDPYMRGRMSAARSYAKPVEVGEVMEGGTVSRIVASRRKDFSAGDIVLARAGWQEYAVSDGSGLRKLDPARAPISTALGVLGMPGMTAYTGLNTIGQPQAGETVVVAAAAGPVGSTVGQIGRAVVDRRVEAELLDEIAALVGPAGDADGAAAFDLGDLADGGADRPGGGRNDDGFARLGLADDGEPGVGGHARHAEHAQRGRERRALGIELAQAGAVGERVFLPAGVREHDVAHGEVLVA